MVAPFKMFSAEIVASMGSMNFWSCDQIENWSQFPFATLFNFSLLNLKLFNNFRPKAFRLGNSETNIRLKASLSMRSTKSRLANLFNANWNNNKLSFGLIYLVPILQEHFPGKCSP